MLAAVDNPLPLMWLFATIPFWPLIGAIVVGVMIATRQSAEKAHLPVIGGVALSAVLSLLLFFTIGGQANGGGDEMEISSQPVAAVSDHGRDGRATHAADKDLSQIGSTYTLFHWMSLGYEESVAREPGFWIDFSFFFDGLTGIMMLFVTVVGTLIVIYAAGYMRDHHGHPERGYERFFAFLGMFVFSMAVLVLAGNFVLLYVGWELVGLCSYLLIGFYYNKPSAAAAAKKAFIVNRIGDLGFALGIFALYMFIRPYCLPGENALDYTTVFKYAGHLAEGTFWGASQSTVVALLLLCGAVGKSAQFPLYVWLPDAMEGPTPVSALIHAATMVTAGIYMIARCGPIFAASETALTVIAVLGAIGALLTATMAMAQYDLKRILAYSTISQLAYMFVGLGVGVSDSAVFHVFTHAWFKALLFLCAGCVMHSMGGVIDIRQFSGLRRVLPKTHVLMLIGCLALAGVPPLAGFWSKDEIVHAAFAHNQFLGAIMILTAALTAYYTFRMYFMCFHGPLRLPKEAGEHPHESPPMMIRPLYVLAGGALVAGFLGVTWGFGDPFSTHLLGIWKPHGFFHHYLQNSTIVVSAAHSEGGIAIAYISALIALGGIGLAWGRYGAAPQEDPDAKSLGLVFALFHKKYFVDELYDAIFVRPLRKLGDVCFGTDRNGVDTIVWFVAFVPRALGGMLRFVHRGALQGYALSMVIGLAVLLAIWGMVDAA